MNILNTLYAIGALTMAATPLVAVAGVAHAEPAPPAAHIQVADLDFTRPADVVRFNQRVDVAGQAICDSHVDPVDLSAMNACRSAIREEATEKLGADQRQAMHTAQLGGGWQVAGR